MKNITHLVFMIILISLKSSFAFAGNGYCTSVDGAANLQYDWGTYTLTDVAQNTPGTILAEKQLNASGSPVTLNCDCSGGPYQNAWIWGDTTLSGKVTVGDYNYYDMPDNDYLQVGVVVYTQKDNIWHPLPFGPISNVNNGDAYSCNQDFQISTGGTHTGSQIKVSLRIKNRSWGCLLSHPYSRGQHTGRSAISKPGMVVLRQPTFIFQGLLLCLKPVL